MLLVNCLFIILKEVIFIIYNLPVENYTLPCTASKRLRMFKFTCDCTCTYACGSRIKFMFIYITHVVTPFRTVNADLVIVCAYTSETHGVTEILWLRSC